MAESKQHENADNLRREHLDWLKQTGQEEAAGGVKEQEGDYLGAIRFYLKGGLPGRAAAVVVHNHARAPFDQSIIEEIAQALKRAAGVVASVHFHTPTHTRTQHNTTHPSVQMPPHCIHSSAPCACLHSKRLPLLVPRKCLMFRPRVVNPTATCACTHVPQSIKRVAWSRESERANERVSTW